MSEPIDNIEVSIVILNYNTANLLEQLLPSVLATNYQGFEVVVVDNASSDNSCETVTTLFPQVRLIKHSQNLGFADGYNQALSQLTTPFWVLLNSDVEVDPDWLQPMMDFIKLNPSIAATGPKILDYYSRNRFEYAGAAGGYMDKWAYPFCRGRLFDTLEEDQGQYNDAREVFWVSGAAFLVRASVYRELGGLDALLFAHMEEIDLCWRMKNSGYEVWICPKAKVYHMGGGTLSKQNRHKSFLNFRNNLAIIVKNAPRHKLLRHIFIRLLLDSIAAIRYLFSSRWRHCFAIIHAHWDFFFFFGRWWNARPKEGVQFEFSKHAGYFRGSVVEAYFLRGLRKFSELKIAEKESRQA